MPKRCRNRFRSTALMQQRSWQSTYTCPSSGCINPMMCFSVTLFPVPDPPTITTDSPFSTSMERSRNTGRPLNDLWRCCSEIVGSSLISEEELGQKKVAQQNDERCAHHRIRRRSSHTFRAAARVIAAHAACQRENETEHRGLDHAAPDVLHLQKLIRVLLVDDGVGVHQFHADEISAADAEGVAEDDQEREHEDAGDDARHEQIV